MWTIPRSIAVGASLLVDRRVARIALPVAAAAAEIHAGSPTQVVLIAAGLLMTLGYLLAGGLDLVPRLPRITARFTIGAIGLAFTAAAKSHPLPALLAAAILARDTTVRFSLPSSKQRPCFRQRLCAPLLSSHSCLVLLLFSWPLAAYPPLRSKSPFSLCCLLPFRSAHPDLLQILWLHRFFVLWLASGASGLRPPRARVASSTQRLLTTQPRPFATSFGFHPSHIRGLLRSDRLYRSCYNNMCRVV